MIGILGLGPEKLPFRSALSLGQDFHAGNANAFVLGPKSIVRACDIAVHHPPRSLSFRTNSFSCPEFPVFQSLRSCSRITWAVWRVQHNSVLSAKRRASLRLVNAGSERAFDRTHVIDWRNCSGPLNRRYVARIRRSGTCRFLATRLKWYQE
jgi:hypothetical protein